MGCYGAHGEIILRNIFFLQVESQTGAFDYVFEHVWNIRNCCLLDKLNVPSKICISVWYTLIYVALQRCSGRGTVFWVFTRAIYIQYNGELIPPNEHYSNKKLLLLFSECNSHFWRHFNKLFYRYKNNKCAFLADRKPQSLFSELSISLVTVWFVLLVKTGQRAFFPFL